MIEGSNGKTAVITGGVTGISEDHFDRRFDTNVRGLVFTVQKALPLMGEGGAIVLTSSVSAFTGDPKPDRRAAHDGNHQIHRPHPLVPRQQEFFR